MKRLKIIFALLPILLFAWLWTISVRKRSETSYILAQYPPTPAFKAAVEAHLLPPKSGRDTTAFLFFSTEFVNGNPGTTLQNHLSPQGAISTYRYIYNRAIQNLQHAQLKPTELMAVKSALRDLPPNADKPELKDLLVVSFRDGKTLTTRIYNRRHLPPSVGKIYQIAGIEKDSDRYPTFQSQADN